MFKNLHLPQELLTVIDSESQDFAVKAQYAKPMKNSIGTFIFGLIWLCFTCFISFFFFGPLMQGEEVHFETNGQPTVASLDNLEPLLFPAVFLGFFALIGILILGSASLGIIEKGGYFVGTPTRLIHSDKGVIKSIDWEQFTGNSEIGGDAHKGNLTLEMRSGTMVKRKNETEKFVPNMIYISGVPDIYAIEKMCRKRIKENDPSPSISRS